MTELQDAKVISEKVRAGTATQEENKLYRELLREQIINGTASFNKETGQYTFPLFGITMSKDHYQAYIKGQDYETAQVKQQDNNVMTADKCYKILNSGTSNRTELDRALAYYARNYDIVNAIDEKDNSLRYQKGDTKRLKDIVLSDDYMCEKLNAMAKDKTAGITSQKFLADFGNNKDSAVVRQAQERTQEFTEGLLGNGALYLTDQDDFKLPDMGDYYLGNVDTAYFDAINKKYAANRDAKAATCYTETIPEKTLGYYADKDLYFLKATISVTEKDFEDGFIGPDFLTLSIDQLSSAEGDGTKAIETLTADIAAKTKDSPLLKGNIAGNIFELKLIGISAQQPARWCYESNVPKALVKFKGYEKEKLDEYKTDTYVISDRLLFSDTASENNHSANGTFDFVFANGKWHEAELIQENKETYDFRWLISAGDKIKEQQDNVNSANYFKTSLCELLKKSKNTIYLRFSGNGISTGSTVFPGSMTNSLINLSDAAMLTKMAEGSSDMTKTGLNRIHVQNCRRYLGEAYVKVTSELGTVYINIAKYLLTGELDPEYIKYSDDYEGPSNNPFKIRDYDINSRVYADAFFETLDELDDRKQIQKELFNLDWDSMHDWNVTLGDVTFFVPPINIRMQTYTRTERMPLLRAKRSAAKTSQHMDRILTMDIFFNEDRGINGYAWTTNLDNSDKTPITYSINGLRALVSMFRFTPFLPITNSFINRTLGIDAVVVSSLDISSVPDYPKLIQATITMVEFEWRVYMPDIVQLQLATSFRSIPLEQDKEVSEDEETETVKVLNEGEAEQVTSNNVYHNWFEKTINWKTFRYYYQRPIRRGDFIKTLNYDFNSEEYIAMTSGAMTSLVPMSFQDPSMKFYMANEDYLKEVLKVKYNLLSRKADANKIGFNQDQLAFLQAISALNSDLQTLATNSAFLQNLNSLNTVTPGTVFSDISDAFGNARPDNVYNKGCITNPMTVNSSILAPLNECLAQVDEITKNTRMHYSDYFEATPEYASIIDKDKNTVSFAVVLKLKDGNLTVDEMDSLKKNLKILYGSDPFTETGNWQGPIDSLKDSKENKLIIPLTVDIRKDTFLGTDQYKVKNNSFFRLNGNSPGMKLISTANKVYETYSKKGDKSDTVPDVDFLMHLVYDDYIVLDEDSPGFLVTSWSAKFTNKIAQLRALTTGGLAPQYLGGEDIDITVHIQTRSAQIATMLTAIPKQIARLTRTYHLVMPCIPLRVESEFTKFLGVNEVTCEDAHISTEPQNPGLYNITMVLRSMDRTMREHEAAQRRAMNNSGWNYYGDDSWSRYAIGTAIATTAAGIAAGTAGVVGGLTAGGVLLATAGASAAMFIAGAPLVYGLVGSIHDYFTLNDDKTMDLDDDTPLDKNQMRKYKQYFEMKNALAELDLYPDLELPTIKEMEAVGFYFTRYKFQDNRMYVDPDFYFIYPVKLTSHIYRELAIHGVESGIADTVLTDTTGASIKIEPNNGTGYTIVEKNDRFKQQEERSRNRRKVMNDLNAEQKRNGKENIKRTSGVEMPFMSLLDLTMERDTWAICDNIHGMFLERKFLQEVKSYEADEDAAAAANVNETRGTSIGENTTAADQTEPAAVAVQTQEGAIKNVTHTEGHFIYNELKTAVEAAETFYNWLSTTTIESTMTSMAQPATTFFDEKLKSVDITNSLSNIKPAVVAFLGIDAVQDLLTGLKIDINEQFIDIVSNIIYAAACAATGRKEYSGSKSSADWQPDIRFAGVQLGAPQNGQGKFEVLWDHDTNKWQDYYNAVVKRGIEFGCFRIKMYSKAELQNMLYKEEKPPVEKERGIYEDGNINGEYYLLDPGYRTADIKTIEEYKGKCITSTTYATYAYMRLVCYWLCRLIHMRVFPNLSTDIMRSRANLEISIQDSFKEVLGEPNSEVMVQGSGNKMVSLRKYIDFFSKNMHIIDAGKVWTAAVITTAEADQSIINAIDRRDYDALNAVVETCTTPSTKIEPLNNKGALTIRKMTLALAGLGVIESIQTIGVSQLMPTMSIDNKRQQQLYVAAAEDPAQFIPHSFHDMVVTDARGRMLRAFPTFYMCFIDEGREIGFWKLHDNFYDINSISQIEVVKSRKLPTDVCTVTMSNFFGSFATEQDDYIRTPVATIEQSWNSIFSPSEYFKEQEIGRRNRPQEVRLRLRAGARMHVRMGYGNNAAMLPVLFNGVVTEITAEDMVQIIAQGDGVELLNPINIDKEAHNLPNEDDILGYSASNGATPLQIAEAIFRTHGGFVNEQIRKRLHLNITSRNPFGIVHFGDPDFTTFCKKGECCQNLYEMVARPLCSNIADTSNWFYSTDDITRITFDLFQKTPWDCLNICKSITPDARLAVLPFGFRSTVFMGLPHYYYAYDYYKDENNVIKERRKPFQQWHIYTAEQDIMANGIAATDRDVKTVAIGLFQVCETFNTKSQQKVGPLYADWDIYTEKQKTMVVDTSLLGKGIPFIGPFTNFFSTLGIGTFDSGGIDAFFDDTGFIASHKKIAWRATATALRESVMDMYAGDLIVFGDPSVKPQDRIFIADKYSGISGQALVKEVVHHMSVDQGFITTISPDCIAVVNDNTELIKYEAMNRIGNLGAASASLTEDLYDSDSWAGKALRLASWAAIGGGTAKLVGASLSKAAKQALAWIGPKLVKTGVAASLNAIPILGQAAFLAYCTATVASTLIMPFIDAWVENELKNYKVITIYPFKKYGYAWTAGFEGARGTVYGSPTWGDRGSLGDVLDFLDDYPILSAIGDLLFSDEVKSLVSKYKKDNNIPDEKESKDEVMTLDDEAGRLMAHIAGSEDSFFSNSYRAQLLQPRATEKTPMALTNAYNYYKKLDTKNWKANLGENRLISQDARIIPYVDDKFFLIAHEAPGLPVDGKSVTDETFDIGGKIYRTKAIHTVDGQGNAVIDIPLLNRQALNILYEILKRAKNYMPNANSTDPNEFWEQIKNDYIILKSGLRIGDRTSMGATGFTFILEGTSANSQRALKAALENMDSEFKSYQDVEGVQSEIFKYVQQSTGEISVIVTMPQVSMQDEPTVTEEDDTAETVKSADNNTTSSTN